MPLRQSFVMGVADEESRSKVAAISNVPSQVLGSVSPTVASFLVQNISEEAPVWLATVAFGINAALFGLFFKDVKPPEEERGAKKAAERQEDIPSRETRPA